MGFVYVLRAKGTNFYKIGRTEQSIENRVRSLQTGCPYKIEILHRIETNYPLNMERAFHDYLDGCQTVGEWFDIDEDILGNMLYMSRSVLEGYRPL